MSWLAHPTDPVFTFDAHDDDWSVGDPRQCIVCSRPAFCRDPNGQPRHRVDCLEPSAESLELAS